MKKILLKALKTMAEKSIATANKTTCTFWSYQPKAPANIKKFKK